MDGSHVKVHSHSHYSLPSSSSYSCFFAKYFVFVFVLRFTTYLIYFVSIFAHYYWLLFWLFLCGFKCLCFSSFLKVNLARFSKICWILISIGYYLLFNMRLLLNLMYEFFIQIFVKNRIWFVPFWKIAISLKNSSS